MLHCHLHTIIQNQRLRVLQGLMPRLGVLAFAGLLLVLFGESALAQSELATLTGTVSDPSGGVIANADITITNQGTNISTVSRTNESGRYLVPSLKPGVYSVTASAAGFKKYVNTGITLQVNQTARLDIELTVGEVTQEVTVSSEAPLLEVSTSSRGSVIDQQKIVELPLNGRDYNQLAVLSPGVLTATPRLQSIGFKGVFNVNGNRAFQNAFQLDGVDNTSYSNSFRGGNTQVVQPSIDALQEFKIQTNAYSAEFGRSSGALVNAVIKSGTNNVHGSAYEFHRNDNLDASNFFSNKNNAPKPFRLRNQFGGTIGGPIVANKTFFFTDYEGLRDRAGTVRLTSVPQPAWRQGRFTIPISNPYNPADTGQDFRQAATPDCNNGSGSCWIIPQNLIDPVGKRIVDVNANPNTGAPGQIDNNFVAVPIERNRTDQFDVRIDHNLSTNFNIFGRYSFADTNIFKPGPRPGLSEGSFNDTFGSALWRSQAIAAGATWVVSPALVSEMRFGWARGNFFQTPPNFGSGCPEQLIGLKGAPTDESICGGIPVTDLPGGNLRRIGRTTSVPQFQTPRSYDFRDSFAWTRGNHGLKFGGEILHVQTGIRDVSTLLGRFNFTGRFTGQNGQYQGGIADLLLGFPTRYQQDSNTVFNQWQRMYFLFAQDDWQVNSKLTLNVGLRYEFATPARERDNQWANFDPSSGGFVQAKNGGLFERALIRPDYDNFAPRFGFAYALSGGTVLRGAYGVFYNHTSRQGREGLLGFNLPFIVQGDSNISGSGTLKASNAIFRLQDGIPAGFVDITKVNQTTVSRKAQDPNQRTTYVQQWNFGIQRELVPNLVMDVAYVGNKGTKLAAFRNLNQRAVSFNATTGAPIAGPQPLSGIGLAGEIQFQENLGISNYHSLQARLEKRFSDGLSALVSYTWGKALTNSVDHLSTSGAGNGVDVGVFREPQNGLDRAAEYGLAEFDVKQRFVASAIWQFPFGRGRHFGTNMSALADHILGGWEFSPIITLQQGLGLTITQSQLLNLGGERRSRPNRVGNGNLESGQQTVERFFDTNAFVILQTNPALQGFVRNQAFGNSGAGVIRGPNLLNLDFNLNKTFKITERNSLQFRAEFFNAFNRANLGVPGVNIGAGFGEIVNTSTEARIIQFGLKYRF
jgi:hypothetical protein